MFWPLPPCVLLDGVMWNWGAGLCASVFYKLKSKSNHHSPKQVADHSTLSTVNCTHDSVEFKCWKKMSMRSIPVTRNVSSMYLILTFWGYAKVSSALCSTFSIQICDYHRDWRASRCPMNLVIYQITDGHVGCIQAKLQQVNYVIHCQLCPFIKVSSSSSLCHATWTANLVGMRLKRETMVSLCVMDSKTTKHANWEELLTAESEFPTSGDNKDN